MKLEEALIDIDSINSISSELTLEYLKEIHQKYCISVEQLLTMLSSPLFLMSIAMFKVKQDHLSLQSAAKLGVITHHHPKDPKIAADMLIKFFKDELKKSQENIVDDAQKESQEFYEKSPEIRAIFNNIGLNTLINSWTYFESYSKEIWVNTLNLYPELLNNKLINNKDSDNNNGKMISLNILNKYNYNISNHLGDVLVSKFDFTSVDGIKKAYNDLLQLNDDELGDFTSEILYQFEICRHVIVHNASILDDKYISKSKLKNEIIGQKLVIEMSDINNMINNSIYCLKSIFMIVEKKVLKMKLR